MLDYPLSRGSSRPTNTYAGLMQISNEAQLAPLSLSATETSKIPAHYGKPLVLVNERPGLAPTHAWFPSYEPGYTKPKNKQPKTKKEAEVLVALPPALGLAVRPVIRITPPPFPALAYVN